MSYALRNLDLLEAEAIHIIREVAAGFENPVLLYSIGKDSMCMLHVARKAFAPGPVPFPLLHIDTTWNFREMIAFRDRYCREHGLRLIVHVNERALAQGMNPFDFPSSVYTPTMNTHALIEALDRLADLVPPPRKHRHRYHGAFAPNHKLRPAVTALAIGNIGKRREAVTGGHAAGLRATGGCCDANPNQKPRSHDTSRIAWAKLMARVGEEFPLECPNCGGDIRLIAFITAPGPIRKILTHLGEPLEPPPVSPARGPPTDWGELVQIHDDRDVFQASPDELPAIDIHNRL
jgi:hypothetical protein